eukprot:TRINITY_DN2179_c0_g1_i16.p1 TRINITY_DN2179_c0_g1~~TRINITY_DN2179_c0_g1_i16.p1  ORF type:complete len:113 (-),score=22.86 TRINITY_DN2179_c0_g1_i16:95-433(-)
MCIRDRNKQVLDSLKKKTTADNQMMIPLTSSLYVSGVIADRENFLIDLGTGYYVERNTRQASEYCDRKIAMLKENVEKLTKIITEKSQQIDTLTLVLQKKVNAIMAAQQKKA